MAWETKDKVQTSIAIASMAISLFTFAVVERQTVDERDVKRAREYEFSYNLGRRFAEASRIRQELNRASASAGDYRTKLQRQELWSQTAIQSDLAEHELQIDIGRFLSGGDNENLYDIVNQHIQERYGADAALAFTLGDDMQNFKRQMDSMWPDTATEEKCARTDDVRTGAMEHNNLHIDPPKNIDCEWELLDAFPSAVFRLNGKLQALGITPLIKEHPKSMEDVEMSVAKTTKALEDQWAR